MKYYIDFEASEAEQKIISVGCIREDGQEFYSLVNVDDPITPRIEEITGISQEEIDNAPLGKEVFSNLYDWLTQDELPEIMCYGDGDFDFVYHSMESATCLKESSILSYLYLNMIDVSEEIKEHFYVNKTISLEKLGKHYNPDMEDQNHNALDDAILLKNVYEQMKNNNKELNTFTEYLDPRRYPDQVRTVLRLNGDTILQEFKNLDEAVTWLKTQPNEKGPSYLKDAAEKIKKAAKENGKYFKSNWRIL